MIPRIALFCLIACVACRQTPNTDPLSATERAAVYKILSERLDAAVVLKKHKGRTVALPIYEQLLTDATRQLGGKDSAVAELQGKLANQYYYAYRFREAVQLYQQAVGIWQAAGAQRYAGSIATFEIYIGNALTEMGQLSEGELYYRQALPYFGAQRDTTQLIELHNLMGWTAFLNQSFAASIGHFKDGLVLKPTDVDRAMLNHNIGRAYRASGGKDLSLSLDYLQKAAAFYSATDSVNAAQSFIELAQTQLKLNDYAAATTAAQRSLDLRIRALPTEIPECYRVLGSIAAQKGQTEKALGYFQQSLQALVPTFDAAADVRANPLIDAAHFDRKIELVEALSLKITPLSILFQKTRNQAYLQAALSTTRAADAVIQQLRHEMLDEASKFFWNATALPLYEKGICAADKLFDLTQNDSFQRIAFNFCRRTKAPVLADALRENRVKDFASVPAEMRQRERDLKHQIAAAQKAVLDNDNKAAFTQLDAARRQLNELQDTLHRQYARYYRLAYEAPPLSITDLQSNLMDSTLAVEYFLGKDTIYTYAWTKHKGFHSFKSPRPADFDARFDHLLRALRDQDLIQDKTDSSQYANQWFCENAFAFYNLLLKQPLDYFNQQQTIKRLRLIPDGKLAYLPFDVLTDKPITNWHGRQDIWRNYLLANFAISYVYNDEEMIPPSVSRRFSSTFGGFSVSYQTKNNPQSDSTPLSNGGRDFVNDKKKLHPLPYAKQEVANISLLFGNGGQIWSEAQKSDFMRHATECGIIHLSLHGYMDEDDPTRSALIFAHRDSTDADFFLSTSEIYGMQFSNTGLAILSACNTGNGKYERGEGVMSMARAFEMAGCPSTIVSLWSIPDSSTATIMAHFHAYQAQGVPKDVALQQAKIEYLSHNQTGQLGLPNYWAATAVIGDVTPVMCGATDYKWYWLGGLLLLVTVVVVLFRRKY